MKKIILNLLLVLNIIFCCSCAIKQPILENKHIVENAPFCLTSELLLEYSLIMLMGDMSAETYNEYAEIGCCVTNANYPIKIITSSFGISKVEMISGVITVTGYTFDDFVRNY